MFRAPRPRTDSARPFSKIASLSHSPLPLACCFASPLFSSPYKLCSRNGLFRKPLSPHPLSFHIDLSCPLGAQLRSFRPALPRPACAPNPLAALPANHLYIQQLQICSFHSHLKSLCIQQFHKIEGGYSAAERKNARSGICCAPGYTPAGPAWEEFYEA